MDETNRCAPRIGLLCGALVALALFAGVAPSVAAALTVEIFEPPSGGLYRPGQFVETEFGCRQPPGVPLVSCVDSNGSLALIQEVFGWEAYELGDLDTSSPGEHEYSALAKTSLGEEARAAIHYTVAEPPRAVIAEPVEGAVVALGGTVPTSFACAEGAGGPGTITSCEDGAGATGGAGALDTSEPGEHEYTVTARSSDGFSSSTTIHYTVEPLPPPVASITSPADGRTFGPDTTVPTSFACAEGAGGPGTITSCEDGAGATGGAGALDTSEPGEHEYTVRARSSDGLNSTTTIHYTVAPLPPPVASITSPADGRTFGQGATVPTSFACSDSVLGPGIESCTDSGGAAAGAGRLDTSSPGAHLYTVTARSLDGLEDSRSIAYTVAPFPAPSVTIEDPVDGRTYAVGAVVPTRFTCGDGGPGLESCTDSNGDAGAPGGGEAAGTGTLDTSTPGLHVYEVSARSGDGLAAVGAISYLVSAAGEAPSVWFQGSAQAHPPAASFAPMAPAPGGGVVLVDGGRTWQLRQGAWSELSQGQGPPATEGAAMAYDPAAGGDVLFGGGRDSGTSPAAETWAYADGRWTRREPATSPPGRYGAMLAYDPRLEELVLFGGYGEAGPLDDTWTYADGEWTEQHPDPSPPADSEGGLAYDPGSQELVLFGGRGLAGQTWSYDGTRWVRQQPVQRPPAPERTGAALVGDPAAGGVLLFGGAETGHAFDDTWLYANGEWSEQALPLAPSARLAAAAAYDGEAGRVVLFGGVGPEGEAPGDTWTYGAIDPPTATIDAPPDGAVFRPGEAVAVGFHCADSPEGSGIAACTGPDGDATGSGSLDTGTLGAHTYTVTATSLDGLIGTATIGYTVAEASEGQGEGKAEGGDTGTKADQAEARGTGAKAGQGSHATPRVSTRTRRTRLQATRVPVEIACRGADCRGTVELSLRLAVARTAKGHPRKKPARLVLGKAGYRLPAGAGAIVKVAVGGRGRRVLAGATRGHPVVAGLTLRVEGGKSVTRRLEVT